MNSTIIQAVVFLALCAGIWIVMLWTVMLADRWLERRRTERVALPPECVRTCVNARPECFESESECLRYEPRRVKKTYNPHTGEVG